MRQGTYTPETRFPPCVLEPKPSLISSSARIAYNSKIDTRTSLSAFSLLHSPPSHPLPPSSSVVFRNKKRQRKTSTGWIHFEVQPKNRSFTVQENSRHSLTAPRLSFSLRHTQAPKRRKMKSSRIRPFPLSSSVCYRIQKTHLQPKTRPSMDRSSRREEKKSLLGEQGDVKLGDPT